MKYRFPTIIFKACAPAFIALAGSLTSVNAGPADGGGGGGYSYLAEAEIARREHLVIQADEAYWRGKEFEDQGELEAAGGEFRSALDILPVSPNTEDRRRIYSTAFANVCTRIARMRMDEGKFDEALRYLEAALSASPDHKGSNKLLAELEDPEMTNPVDTYEHRQKVEEVLRRLKLARSDLSIGRHDKAEGELFEVLRADPYNTAARRQLEDVENSRWDYYRTATDHTRSEFLKEIDRRWETPIPPSRIQLTQPDDEDLQGASGVDYINTQLKTTIIPSIELENVTINEAIGLLRSLSQELDPGRRGISFVIDESSVTAAGASTRPISLKLRGVPMVEVLRYMVELAGLRYQVDAFAVSIISAEGEDTQLFQKVYSVPPSFLSYGTGGGADAETDDPFAATDPGADGGIAPRASAADILKNQGVPFPEGASAFFSGATSQLVVRNTQRNLQLVDAFVDSIQVDVPKQIQIRTKFVEVYQENLEELGFDWTLGQFTFRGDSLAGAGGTYGDTGLPTESNAYPFLNAIPPPVGSPPGTPPTFVPVGQNPVTAGLRNGDFAIEGNAIDALIRGQGRGDSASMSQAPGVLSLAGVLTDPEFQVVLRALSQKKGIDLLVAPMVTTKSTQQASIQIIRELIYPTEYDPPELPQSVGTNAAGSFPVTPATPTAFETRDTGVTLEVDPVVGPDGFSIDLNLAPEVVEFEGFVNYGSPITTAGVNALNQTVQIVITENRIDMPVFATRRATTNVTIWDGQTVAIGGLITEAIQHVRDKVPILGDLPWVGRLFRSESEQTQRRNLMVFVTVNLIDPAGQKVRGQGDESEGIGSLSPSVLPTGGGPSSDLLPPPPVEG